MPVLFADAQANAVVFIAVGTLVAVIIAPATVKARDTLVALADQVVVAIIVAFTGRTLGAASILRQSGSRIAGGGFTTAARPVSGPRIAASSLKIEIWSLYVPGGTGGESRQQAQRPNRHECSGIAVV